MKLLLALGILLVGSYSFADFTGDWAGEGTVTLKDGREIYCDEIEVRVTQSKEKLSFGRFRYGCDELAFSFVPPDLKVENERVIWKEADAGFVNDKKARLHFTLANNGRSRYSADLISETEMDYLDEQIDHNPDTGEEKITAIKAKIFKK